MSICLDAIVIFVFIVSVYFAYRRGLLHTILHFLSYFVSLFVASMLSSALSDFIYDQFIRKSVVSKLTETLTTAVSQGTIDTAIQQLNDQIPAFLLGGTDINSVIQPYLLSQNLDSAANIITNQVFTPIITSVLSFFLFFLLFALCKMVFHFIYRAAGVVRHIPGVHLINGLAGGVFGILEAVIFNALLAVIVYLIIFFTGDTLSWLNTGIVEQTNLFILFYRFNVLLLF